MRERYYLRDRKMLEEREGARERGRGREVELLQGTGGSGTGGARSALGVEAPWERA